MEHDHPTVYHRGATDGLTMGCLMAVTFVAMAYASITSSFLLTALSLLLMAVAVPLTLFRQMRRTYIENECQSHFSTVWMHGISAMIFGNVILGFVIYVFIRFVEPSFLVDQVHQAIEAYRRFGEQGEELVRTLERMLEMKLLPTPISFAFSVMWFGSFAGAMLSLLFTLIIKVAVKPRP